jgi:hypothetical protein
VQVFTANSSWPDKEEFLDVIYWARQLLGVLLGRPAPPSYYLKCYWSCYIVEKLS